MVKWVGLSESLNLMNKDNLLGRLVVGAAINFVVLYFLEQIDNRLAMLYLVTIFIMIMITYRDQIFPNINLLLGMVKGGTE